ncbi:MAG TPA: hypothetical protein VEB68_12320 [Croceibacterium sp.]|nr:hypothetical protein [Croceibacterium sp.]
MRWTIFMAVSLTAVPAAAQEVAIDSSVYRERADGSGGRQIEPATRLLRGDRVVTIMRWQPPRAGRFTVVSAVPPQLAIESASQAGIEVSTDGGLSWRRLADPDAVPRGTTHLRWQLGDEGRMSYRAVVR